MRIATHPLQRVVDEVEGVAELTANGEVGDNGILDRRRLDGSLEVLEELADAHH